MRWQRVEAMIRGDLVRRVEREEETKTGWVEVVEVPEVPESGAALTN